MELMNQPFTGQLGDRLIELLDSSKYHTLNIAVAFAKNSGILRIKEPLERFRAQGGKVNICVGVDLGGTSYEALTALLLHTDSLNIVHSEKGQTFHSKIYQFIGEDIGLVIVGSHNLTGGGLWTNFESSIHVPLVGDCADNKLVLMGLDNYFETLTSLENSFMRINAQDEVDGLLKNGYVFKEVAERVRQQKATISDGNRKRLFGNGVTAHLPRISGIKYDKVADIEQSITPESVQFVNDEAQYNPEAAMQVVTEGEEALSLSFEHDESPTIWFETRKMTGGSRNILDLSMKSLVEKGDVTGTSFDLEEKGFMRGGVEFFGLNPLDTNHGKDITLNFEGVDYYGNTILFPVGEKANGTWRLQIKGISNDGRRITDAFKAHGEEYYLIAKIISFTQIQSDYYFISIFPESEIEDFRSISRILARNGSNKTAKQFGIF
ncbi:hypothetical protein R84981_001783 [Carnimonas sp. R-84981]|uniref:hypothetical protein n=1 Tax=Carnimonas bestiolae TaxID=3402172 RepID=UPI003EDC3EE0